LTDWIPQIEYDRIISYIPIVCVDCVVIFEGQVLLIKRRDEPMAGEWWLPGGRLWKGESLNSCALRKVQRETGLHCKFYRQIDTISTVFDSVHSVNIVYLLHATNDYVELDDTCIAYKWVDKVDSKYHSYVRSMIMRGLASW